MNHFILDELPIFWRESEKILPIDGIPQKFPLEISINEVWGGISQNLNDELLNILNLIYKEEENIGYLQDDNPLADLYFPEFIEFLKSKLPKQSRICEVGAGGCFTLRALKEIGHEVIGIDPSPISEKAGKNFNIKIIKDFFPPEDGSSLKDIDALIHYDVLEHIDDPFTFLKHSYNCLKKNGVLIFVVPDCTSHIKEKDLSMCMHQHLNYFSKTSMQYLLYLAGFDEVEVTISNQTGTLHCYAKKNDLRNNFELENLLNQLKLETKNESKYFFEKISSSYKNVSEFLNNLMKEKKDFKVGFYPPLRAIPYIRSILSFGKDKLFFIDDNKKVQGRYICDIPIKIISREEAALKGVNNFVICSKPFKEIMEENIKKNKNLRDSSIFFLDELINESL
jgi:2-polyprenyl-3-methyl-5-hydroxy-6-metoxy-1,4-benzoquinol methylase